MDTDPDRQILDADPDPQNNANPPDPLHCFLDTRFLKLYSILYNWFAWTWCVRWCLVSPHWSTKPLRQAWQVKGRTPSWRRMWTRSVSVSRKRLLHTVQGWGRTPSCRMRCTFSQCYGSVFFFGASRIRIRNYLYGSGSFHRQVKKIR